MRRRRAQKCKSYIALDKPSGEQTEGEWQEGGARALRCVKNAYGQQRGSRKKDARILQEFLREDLFAYFLRDSTRTAKHDPKTPPKLPKTCPKQTQNAPKTPETLLNAFTTA